MLVKPQGNHVTWAISLNFSNFCVLICKMGLTVFTTQDCSDE